MVPEPGLLVGGRYILEALLDEGGMGAIWSAHDRVSAAPVALKFLSGWSLADRSALKRFQREARALERLTHPNVVRILGHGVEGRAPFIAMQRLAGEPLRALIRRVGTLTPRRALTIARQAAAGLVAAHALGIVHRDIKPSNLFLCAIGPEVSVKVIDFGIATGELLETESHGSATGLIGSPAYMSPEQARGERVTAQADVWSLAVVVFQMLTGSEPFAGSNVPETLQRVCSGLVPVASDAASGLPAGLDEVFARAFAPKRDDRYPDVEALVAALERVYEGAPDRAASSVSSHRRAGRSTATVAFDETANAVTRTGTHGSARIWAIAVSLAVASLGLLATRRPATEARVKTDPPTSASQVQTALALPVSDAHASSRPALQPPSNSARPKETNPPAPNKARATVKARPINGPERPSGVSLAPSNEAPAVVSKSVDVDPIFGLPVDEAHAREGTTSAGSTRSDHDFSLAHDALR